MQVSGQKPAVLSPIYSPKMNGDFKPQEYFHDCIIKPALQPINANTSVTISHDGKTLSANDIEHIVLDCIGDLVNVSAEDTAKAFFSDTLIYFDEKNNLGIQDLFAIQSAMRENQSVGGNQPVVPFPSVSLIYTPATDVIPNCKKFIAGQCSYDVMFTSFAFYARPDTLGFYFSNETSFNDFKAWFSGQTQTLLSALPQATNNLIAEFAKLTLNGLTESLLLRNADDEENDEYSFPRILIQLLMQYTKQVSDAEFGIMPFSLGELFCPKSVVFVNIEKHARASAKQVKEEWDVINKSLANPYTVVSNKKLSKLTAAQRALQKATAAAASQLMKQKSADERAKAIRFRKSELSLVDITSIVSKLINKMAFVNKSENALKCVKTTFAKPNRRDPDDYNKMGKMVSTKYKPDIHIYLDTSGSISEMNYQDAMKACIKLAKKLNVNLYFNSFSHILSQCTKLKVKDKSEAQVYKYFQSVPKVSGGTNFEQIWHYINASKKRRRELSVIVTDFEWYPSNKFVKHPRNLYYMPCSRLDWDSMTHWARNFAKSMFKFVPNIRQHILF